MRPFLLFVLYVTCEDEQFTLTRRNRPMAALCSPFLDDAQSPNLRRLPPRFL